MFHILVQFIFGFNRKTFFVCCVWLCEASIDMVWLPQSSIDEVFRPQKCETFGRDGQVFSFETEHFTISVPENRSINESYEVQKSRLWFWDSNWERSVGLCARRKGSNPTPSLTNSNSPTDPSAIFELPNPSHGGTWTTWKSPIS